MMNLHNHSPPRYLIRQYISDQRITIRIFIIHSPKASRSSLKMHLELNLFLTTIVRLLSVPIDFVAHQWYAQSSTLSPELYDQARCLATDRPDIEISQCPLSYHNSSADATFEFWDSQPQRIKIMKSIDIEDSVLSEETVLLGFETVSTPKIRSLPVRVCSLFTFLILKLVLCMFRVALVLFGIMTAVFIGLIIYGPRFPLLLRRLQLLAYLILANIVVAAPFVLLFKEKYCVLAVNIGMNIWLYIVTNSRTSTGAMVHDVIEDIFRKKK